MDVIEYYSSLKKKNPAICDNVDELGGCYPKWNKPGIVGQTLHDTTYMMNLKELNSEADGRIGVARGWGEEDTGKICQTAQSFNYTKGILIPGDFLYTTVPVVNNTGL